MCTVCRTSYRVRFYEVSINTERFQLHLAGANNPYVAAIIHNLSPSVVKHLGRQYSGPTFANICMKACSH